MPATKTIAAVAVMLLAAGGAVASTGGVSMTDDGTDATTAVHENVEASAAYDNGTVTLTVADGDDPVNATVEVEAGDVERTVAADANGTVIVNASGAEELEVEISGDGFEGELEYAVSDDGLRLIEEEYEYEIEEGEDDEGDDDDADGVEDDRDDEESDDDEAEGDDDDDSDDDDEAENEESDDDDDE